MTNTHISSFDTDNISQPNRRRGLTRGQKTLAVVAGMGLLAVAGNTGYNALKGPSQEAQVLAEWEKSGATAYDGTVVLRQGVKIRSSFQTKNDEISIGQRSNVTKTIGENRVVIIDNPLEYNDKNGDTWYGFMNADKNPKVTDSASSTTGSFNWVNGSILENQVNAEGKPFIEIHPRAGYEADEKAADAGPHFKVSFEAGIFQDPARISGELSAVAGSQEMSAAFLDSALQTRNISVPK